MSWSKASMIVEKISINKKITRTLLFLLLTSLLLIDPAAAFSTTLLNASVISPKNTNTSAAAQTPVVSQSLDLKALYNSKKFYKSYIESLEKLKNKYSDLTDMFEIKDIGKSVRGRSLAAVILGSPEAGARIEINATHHQKEYINTILVLGQIDEILGMYRDNEAYNGTKVRELLGSVQIYFIPLVNPDGVEIFNAYRNDRILPKGSSVLDVTRGNANGVNLNRNYPAGFKKGAECGGYPFSEPETKALKDLHKAVRFDYSAAYHSKGSKILWYYNQKGDFYNETFKIAGLLKSITGYPLKNDEKDMGALGAGFKDWLIAGGEAACTIENGEGSLGDANLKTVDWSDYAKIWTSQKDVPLALANYFYNKNKAAGISKTSGLSLSTLKINGRPYSGDVYLLNDKPYVKRQAFTDFIDNAITSNTEPNGRNPQEQGPDSKTESNKAPNVGGTKSSDIKIVDTSKLDRGLLIIDNEEFTLLDTLAKEIGYHIFWNEVDNEFNTDSTDYMLGCIDPIWVDATVVRQAKVYSDEAMTKEIAVFPKNTKVILLQDRNEVKANIKLKDVSGWTAYKNIRPGTKNYLKNIKLPRYIKEFFVNEMGYTSDTDKLIWVNLENTSVNIFERSGSGWKIKKEFPCSIGKNSTPTVNGVFKYYKYSKSMIYKKNRLIHKMDFYKEYALHSVLLNKDGSFSDGQIHTAVSHGCIRMLPDDIRWVHDNCRLGTTVVTW